MSNLLVRTLGNDGKSLSTSQPDERVVTPENLISRLKNKKIVFFTGAGFSIAWNGSYPDGYRLFLIDDIEAVKENHNFFKVASLLHINEPNIESTNYKSDCLNFFKEIKFHLDIYKRYPSLLPSYLDKTIVQQLENEIRDFIKNKFINLVGAEQFEIANENINTDIRNIFHYLYKNNKSISFITTNYDFIVEQIFNSLDVNIVRGVIDKNAFNDIKLGKDRISLFKINGGFDVFKDGNGFFIDHNLSLSDCPNIILPSKEQNYDDAYFKTVFTKSASKLRDADVLVFIGYSLPEEDHTIRFLLKNFFDSEESDDKEVFIISRNKDSALSNTYPNAVSIFSKMEELEAIKVLDGDLSSLVSFIG